MNKCCAVQLLTHGRDKISFLALALVILFLSPAVAQQVARETPDGTKFWAYTPPSYSAVGAGSPLLISLHGGSSIGDDLSLLNNSSAHLLPSKLIHNNQWNTSRPFVVVSPQLKRDLSVFEQNNQVWPATMVDEVIEYVKTQYNIDANRIYLLGISLGGAGCWTYASTYPEKVAALVPFSGVTHLEEACQLKNIPAWAFHGDNDGLVVPQFTINMVDAINACQPAGLFKPRLSLIPAQGHEGWNPVLNGSSLYDIYAWLLKFQKNNNANKTPYVTAGGDRKIQLPEATFYIVGDYFDSDGSIQSVQWTQTAGPAVTLADANTNTLKLTSLQAGTYTFRLAVTDDDGGVSEDFMQLVVVNNETGAAITGITLTDGDEVAFRDLVQDDVLNLSELGTSSFNFIATGNSNTQSIKFSINAFDYVFLRNTTAQQIFLKPPPNQEWRPAEGTYVICATPFSGTVGGGTSGSCKCFKFTVVRNVYYAKNGSILDNPASWGSNIDGSGAAPASLSDAPNLFVIPPNYTATVSAQTSIHQHAKLVVSTGATLIFNNRLVNHTSGTFANVFAEGNSTIRISVGGVALASVSLDNTTIFESASNISFPPAQYGNLIVRGTGQRTFFNNSPPIVVRKNLVIENGTNVLNNLVYTGEFLVLGSMEIQTAAPYSPLRPFPVRFGGLQSVLTINPARAVFSGIRVHQNTNLQIVNPANPGVIEINNTSSTVPGQLVIEDEASLDLDGHTLHLKNDVAINPDNEKGTLQFDNNLLKLEVNTARNSHIYTKRGEHSLNILDVNATGGSQIIIHDSLKIKDHIKTVNGVIQSNGFIRLVSTANKTASVATVAGTGNIAGVVNVERYFEPGKKYKYVGFPVSGLQVKDLQDYIPVTGSFPQSSAGYSKAASLFYYSESEGGWIAYPKESHTQSLDMGKGYALYMRNENIPEKVVSSGNLHVGNFPFVLTPNPSGAANVGWNLVGNPYASPIKWQEAGWTRSGVNNIVYVRDNAVGGGQFMVWDGVSGDTEFGGVISSGQSFWVRTTSASPQLVVTENAKVLADAKFFRTGSEDVSVLKIRLRRDELEDNTYIKFTAEGSAGLDNARDGVKMKNEYFNLSVLTTEGVPTVIKNLSDTLCIHQTGMLFEPGGPGNYTLYADGSAFEKTITKVKIIDQYLDSTALLDHEGTYLFSVDGNSASAAPDRFTLWVETKSIPDPVIGYQDGKLVSSFEKGNQWQLDGLDIPGATGAEFTPVEDGEYRVKVSKGGCVKHSEKYAFRITAAGSPAHEISIYPNPATARLYIKGLSETSVYEITAVTGSVAAKGEVTLQEEQTGVIGLEALAPGVYFLRLHTGNKPYQFKLFIQ